MKKLFPILGVIVLATGAVLLTVIRPQREFALPISLPTIQPTAAVVSTTPTASNSMDIVKTFLKNISEKKIAEAVAMMTTKVVPDDSTKQAWGVQYAAFKKLVVTSVEPSMPEEWSATGESYKVTMDVEMTPESASGPIPYYGYENGVNIRWITLDKEGGVWKVAGINTGP